jgi:hypothetical protein
MKTFETIPFRNLAKEKRIFNYSLSRARRAVKNAFGILAHRWRVFLTTIKLNITRKGHWHYICSLLFNLLAHTTNMLAGFLIFCAT